ncbi:MAG: hypothetical protein MHM6MM_005814 [Cercozoa sp. M6MM]
MHEYSHNAQTLSDKEDLNKDQVTVEMSEVPPEESTRSSSDYGLAKNHVNLQSDRSAWSLCIAMALHHLPEGIALGVAWAGDPAAAWTISVALALHCIPEGFATCTALLTLEKVTHWQALALTTATALLLVVGGIVGAKAAAATTLLMPPLLGCGAGAMLYVVAIELLPEQLQECKMTRSKTAYSFAWLFGIVAVWIAETAAHH